MTFTADDTGVRGAWINITSNALGSPSRVNVIGTNDMLFFDGFEQK